MEGIDQIDGNSYFIQLLISRNILVCPLVENQQSCSGSGIFLRRIRLKIESALIGTGRAV